MTRIGGCLLAIEESTYIDTSKLITILKLIRKGLGATVKGGFELSFYGGLKMYDLGGLRINRC